MENTEIMTVSEGGAIATQGAMTPMAMIAQAVAQGTPVETLEKLMALQERWDANEAKKAFIAALTKFKENPPSVIKNKHVSFETSKGKTDYWHATLDSICQILGNELTKYGLSWRWEQQCLDQGIIRVTCILQHVMGHSERTSLQATAEAGGGKNHVQGVGSTVTYLERYTLLAAVGIAVQGQDDDGLRHEKDMPITMDQIAQLQNGIDETEADIVGFCKYMRVSSLSEITESGFKRAMDAIDAKRRKAGAI